jgi:hypothetical protein
MDHAFQASQINALECVRCKRGPIEHTNFAQCEACSNRGKCDIWAGMLLCKDCIDKEKKAVADHQTPERQESRLIQARIDGIIPTPQPSGILSLNDVIDKARQIDYSIQVRTDVHNAETIAHYEAFKAIDADSNIPAAQKQYEKAKFLTERQIHFQQVIFEAQNTVVEHQNKNRVIQQEINKLVNTLRKEEREKLQLLSPDYKPSAVKPARETKPRQSKTKSFDKKALVDTVNTLVKEGYVADLSTLQMICTARQMTPAQAADVVRKSQGGVQ